VGAVVVPWPPFAHLGVPKTVNTIPTPWSAAASTIAS
jgi:hypothetical protein